MSDTETFTQEEADQAVNMVTIGFIKAIDDVVTDQALANRIKKAAAANMLASVLELLLEDENGAF